MKRRHGVLEALQFSRISGVYIGLLLLAIYAVWIPDTFFTETTLKAVAGSEALTAILTIGLLLPLAAGQFDLSIGAMVGFSGVLTASLIDGGTDPSVAIAIAIGAGLVLGIVNAVLVVVVGIGSFIATLGTGSLLTAGITAVSNNELIVGLPKGFTELGLAEPFGIPITVLYLVVIAVAFWYVLEHTPFGRHLFAIGSGREAARLAGVRTDLYIAVSLVVCAVTAAFVGVMVSAKIGAGSPTIGAPYLLPAFAAAFLGSTQVKRNRFNVIGTLIAIYLLAIGVKGLQLGGSPEWVTSLFDGLALIIAVGLSRFQGKLRLSRQSLRRRRATLGRGDGPAGAEP